MQTNHPEKHPDSQALFPNTNGHRGAPPGNPSMNTTSQGVQFRCKRNQMGTLSNMHFAASSYIPDHGFRSTDQHYSAPRPNIQAPTSSYRKHNTAQTYQIPPSVSSWGPGPGSINGYGHIQSPSQRYLSNGIASNYLVHPSQGYQNGYSVHPSGDNTPRIGRHHSMMTGQGPSYAPYSTQPQAHSNHTIRPNACHPYTESGPSPGRSSHHVGNHPEHDFASGTISPSEQYKTQNSKYTQTNIDPRPGSHAGDPDYSQGSSHPHHTSEASSKKKNMQVTQHGPFLLAPTATVGPAAAGNNLPPSNSLNTASTPPTLSEADRVIREATEKVMSIFQAKESTLSEQPQSPYRSPTPGSDSALSTPKAEWENPEYDAAKSQTDHGDGPEEGSVARPIELDQTSNQGSATSSSGRPEALVKCKRGRPNLEEQRIRDLADPEGARLRKEEEAAMKAAEKAGQKAAKQAASKGKGKKNEKGSVHQGSSTIKISDSDAEMSGPEQEPSLAPSIEDEVEEERLNSAGAETRKVDSKSTQPQSGSSTTRKRVASIGFEEPSKRPKSPSGPSKSNTEYARHDNHNVVSATSNGKKPSSVTSPIEEPKNMGHHSEASSNKSIFETEMRRGYRSRSRSVTIVNDLSQAGLPGSADNPMNLENLEDENAVPVIHIIEQQAPPVVVLPPPAPYARNRIKEYFGPEYCRKHEVREIQSVKAYHSSTLVLEVPRSITHILTCSAALRVQPRLGSHPTQEQYCVYPNEFRSLSNAELTRVVNFIHQGTSVNHKLVIAPTTDDAFESTVIDALVVLACVLAEYKTWPGKARKRNTITNLSHLRRKFPGWNLQPPVELLDDFDFFLQWGQGSERHCRATNQWKEFLDAIGDTNKRRKEGPNSEYIEVQDFKDILSAVPLEPTCIELNLPVPLNKRTLARTVLDWWEEQDSDYVPWEFSRTKLLKLIDHGKVEPERELWPGDRSMTEDEAYQEAIFDHESMNVMFDWACGTGLDGYKECIR